MAHRLQLLHFRHDFDPRSLSGPLREVSPPECVAGEQSRTIFHCVNFTTNFSITACRLFVFFVKSCSKTKLNGTKCYDPQFSKPLPGNVPAAFQSSGAI